ncbi:MAG: molecular chaperone TorD family protein [Candidatus Kapabacteria bacterium]|nr:molecular chaperone TorD family protein [Ignavibacteriota bacterium]MCW5884779.1 molecular chaperone TorD family protein [Candidatus Kapabacteria bacterium]
MELITKKIQAINILTALFCQPENDILAGKDIYIHLQNALKDFSDNAFESATKLNELYNQKSEIENLADYTKIFMGPFEAIAHPYSSVYFGERTLMNDTTEWVLRFYNETGVGYDEEMKDMPDHLVIELEFLYHLNFHLLESINNNDLEQMKFFYERETEFFNKHFAVWIPIFCKKIYEFPINDFYTELAKCLEHFVNDYKIYKPFNN